MKVSVCIPTYNQHEYLEYAVRSAYSQIESDPEVLVFNDASTDSTANLLTRLKFEFPSLIVQHNSNNLGLGPNVKQALMRASGDLIVRLDSDDLLEPHYISELTNLLLSNPQAGYAHCSVMLMDRNSEVFGNRYLSRADGFITGEESLRSLVWGYRVSANVLMFRREALQSVGYSDSSLNFAEDYDLAVRLADAGWGNVYKRSTLARYRVWVDQAGVRSRRKATEIRGLSHVFNKSLASAFRRRSWSTLPLVAGRFLTALNQSRCLSEGPVTASDHDLIKTELYALVASEFLSHAFKSEQVSSALVRTVDATITKALALKKTALEHRSFTN